MTQDIEIRTPYEPVIHEYAQKVWLINPQRKIDKLAKLRLECQMVAREIKDPKAKREMFNNAVYYNHLEVQASKKYQTNLGFYINLIQNVN